MDQDEHDTLLSTLLRQEAELQFDHFGNDDALQVGLRLVEAIRKLGKAGTVSIVRCGHQLFQHAMDGTTPDNADWIRRKENVVHRYGHSSYYMGAYCRSLGTTFEAHTGVDPREFAAHGGCFPITLAGTGIVGTISVSGMPQAEDHAVVVEVLRAYLLERSARLASA